MIIEAACSCRLKPFQSSKRLATIEYMRDINKEQTRRDHASGSQSFSL